MKLPDVDYGRIGELIGNEIAERLKAGMIMGGGRKQGRTYARGADAALFGIPTHTSDHVPEGKIIAIGPKVFVSPLMMWSLNHAGRYPFESRYSRGMLELDRERRRRKAGR